MDDWRRFDQRVADVSTEIEQLAKQDEHCKGLMSVRGVGPMTASAMLAAKRGRWNSGLPCAAEI